MEGSEDPITIASSTESESSDSIIDIKWYLGSTIKMSE